MKISKDYNTSTTEKGRRLATVAGVRRAASKFKDRVENGTNTQTARMQKHGDNEHARAAASQFHIQNA